MQNNSTMFYQKNGLVVIMLSRDLVCLSPEDGMTPIAEYEKRFGFSPLDYPDCHPLPVGQRVHGAGEAGPQGHLYRQAGL